MSENLLDKFTLQAMDLFGHKGSKEYYRRLQEERKLCATRCTSCEEITFPPRDFCPRCFHKEVAWEGIGEGAKLHAFTTQSRALRFTAPAVIGVVEIPNVGLIVAPIAGKMKELKIGQPLRLEVEDLEAGFSVPTFVPEEFVPEEG